MNPESSKTMKIGIYNYYWGWIGGGQRYCGAVAEVLSRDHAVEMMYHADFDREMVEEAMELDLSRVSFRRVPELVPHGPGPSNPIARYQRERDRGAVLSRGYDLFIYAGELVPVFCHAPRGVLITHFPSVPASVFQRRETPEWQKRPASLRLARRIYHNLEWSRRFANYQTCLTCSEFSKSWLRKRWGVDAAVVYPPVRTGWRPSAKQNCIVSLGRFDCGDGKNQAFLLEAFKTLHDSGLSGWRLFIMGGMRDVPENRRYVEALRDQSQGYPISILPNVSAHDLQTTIETASVFWHAKGYDEGQIVDPARMEHFGIVTAETMVAGCVPIVFKGGGQVEIVDHGRNGFLWETADELVAMTLQAIRNPDLRDRMSQAAHERGQAFSKAVFESRLDEVLRPILDRTLRPGSSGRALAKGYSGNTVGR